MRAEQCCGSVVEYLTPLLLGQCCPWELANRRTGHLAPAGLELRQRQIRGQLGAGEPDLVPQGIHVSDATDLVARHFPWVSLRLPPAEDDISPSEQDLL